MEDRQHQCDTEDLMSMTPGSHTPPSDPEQVTGVEVHDTPKITKSDPQLFPGSTEIICPIHLNVTSPGSPTIPLHDLERERPQAMGDWDQEECKKKDIEETTTTKRSIPLGIHGASVPLQNDQSIIRNINTPILEKTSLIRLGEEQIKEHLGGSAQEIFFKKDVKVKKTSPVLAGIASDIPYVSKIEVDSSNVAPHNDPIGEDEVDLIKVPSPRQQAKQTRRADNEGKIEGKIEGQNNAKEIQVFKISGTSPKGMQQPPKGVVQEMIDSQTSPQKMKNSTTPIGSHCKVVVTPKDITNLEKEHQSNPHKARFPTSSPSIAGEYHTRQTRSQKQLTTELNSSMSQTSIITRNILKDESTGDHPQSEQKVSHKFTDQGSIRDISDQEVEYTHKPIKDSTEADDDVRISKTHAAKTSETLHINFEASDNNESEKVESSHTVVKETHKINVNGGNGGNRKTRSAKCLQKPSRKVSTKPLTRKAPAKAPAKAPPKTKRGGRIGPNGSESETEEPKAKRHQTQPTSSM